MNESSINTKLPTETYPFQEQLRKIAYTCFDKFVKSMKLELSFTDEMISSTEFQTTIIPNLDKISKDANISIPFDNFEKHFAIVYEYITSFVFDFHSDPRIIIKWRLHSELKSQIMPLVRTLTAQEQIHIKPPQQVSKTQDTTQLLFDLVCEEQSRLSNDYPVLQDNSNTSTKSKVFIDPVEKLNSLIHEQIQTVTADAIDRKDLTAIDVTHFSSVTSYLSTMYGDRGPSTFFNLLRKTNRLVSVKNSTIENQNSYSYYLQTISGFETHDRILLVKLIQLFGVRLVSLDINFIDKSMDMIWTDSTTINPFSWGFPDLFRIRAEKKSFKSVEVSTQTKITGKKRQREEKTVTDSKRDTKDSEVNDLTQSTGKTSQNIPITKTSNTLSWWNVPSKLWNKLRSS